MLPSHAQFALLIATAVCSRGNLLVFLVRSLAFSRDNTSDNLEARAHKERTCNVHGQSIRQSGQNLPPVL